MSSFNHKKKRRKKCLSETVCTFARLHLCGQNNLFLVDMCFRCTNESVIFQCGMLFTVVLLFVPPSGRKRRKKTPNHISFFLHTSEHKHVIVFSCLFAFLSFVLTFLLCFRSNYNYTNTMIECDRFSWCQLLALSVSQPCCSALIPSMMCIKFSTHTNIYV